MRKYLVLCAISICLLCNNIKAQVTPPIPQDIIVETHQREFILKWKSSDIEQLKWEVIVNNQTPLIATKNEFIVTDLEPDTEYIIKIRAAKDNLYSSFVTLDATKTKSLSKGIEDIRRIPYLWTLATRSNKWGLVSKKIGLFYNDLAINDAKISYAIDGVNVEPIGDYLILNKTGRQKISITIEETKDRIWNLTYNIKAID